MVTQKIILPHSDFDNVTLVIGMDIGSETYDRKNTKEVRFLRDDEMKAFCN